MKRALLTGATMLLTLSSAAFAQTTPTPTNGPVASAPEKTGPASPGIRAQLTNNLEQAGFTDVKVMADSFLVQAKDKSGNPVTMFLNPDSMTVVSAEGPGDQTKKGVLGGPELKSGQTMQRGQPMPNGGTQSSQATQSAAGGMFATVPAQEELSSNLVGLDIYNDANQDIGKIKDVAFDASGVRAYIVGVGGFLGMGDHYVAVRPSAIALGYDATGKKWHATMNTNADQLKAAPEYKYTSNF